MRYTRYSRRYTRYTCDIHGDIRDICDITAISPIYARCTRYTARCTRYTARCTRYTRYPARYTRYARYTPIYTISRAIYAIYTRYKTEKLKSACAGPWDISKLSSPKSHTLQKNRVLAIQMSPRLTLKSARL